MLSTSALVLLSPRIVQSPAVHEYQQMKIPPAEGVQRCSSENPRLLQMVTALCLSASCLLRGHIAGWQLSGSAPAQTRFSALSICRVHVVSARAAPCPPPAAASFALSQLAGLKILLFPSCSDKPSCSQHTRCLSGYPAQKVLIPH